MEDLTGKQFGAYQIVAPLGEGGMAAVYRAQQPAMKRFVAMKVLPRKLAESGEFTARFQREALLLAQLQHPHILPVFDYGQEGGYSYIIMPLLQGGTLADLLRSRRLSLPEVNQVVTQIGDALGYAHARGMIHRDVKPANVLMDERGNCLLTDFGLARMVESRSGSVTSAGTIMGTPAYMSPEQGQGDAVDGRSDLYSLGIILYEMLTGQVPFYGKTPVAIMFKHVNEPVPLARGFVPSLSEAVERVLAKALAKKPDERYQTAEDFVRAVQQAIPLNPGGKAVSRVLDSVYDRLLAEKEGDHGDAEELAKETVIVAPPGSQSPVPPPAEKTVLNPPTKPADHAADVTLLAPPPANQNADEPPAPGSEKDIPRSPKQQP